MKIWNCFASEHSANLVMIGRFKNVEDAEEAKELIEKLTAEVNAQPESYQSDAAPEGQRFSDAMLELLKEARLYGLSPAELEQFGYSVRVQLKGGELVVTTDEVDVSAFLKLLVDRGARVEVYSAHQYPDTGYGRAART